MTTASEDCPATLERTSTAGTPTDIPASDTPTAMNSSAGEQPTGPLPQPTASEPLESDDPALSLERDHPNFERATISLILQLLPEEGPHGRLVFAAVKSHNLPPVTALLQLHDIMPLPQPLQGLLHCWQAHLPTALAERRTNRAKQAEEKRRHEADRQAKQTVKKATPPGSRPSMKQTKEDPPVKTPTEPAGTAHEAQGPAPDPQAQLF